MGWSPELQGQKFHWREPTTQETKLITMGTWFTNDRAHRLTQADCGLYLMSLVAALAGATWLTT
jgi:hypothetical protein